MKAKTKKVLTQAAAVAALVTTQGTVLGYGLHLASQDNPAKTQTDNQTNNAGA